MARPINKLTDRFVKGMSNAGRYSDGDGLELQVSPTGSKSWAFRFMLQGRRRQMGFGGYPETSLADARQKATEARKLVGQGIDPLEHREVQKVAVVVEAAKRKTFQQAAEAYITDHRDSWRGAKTAKLWQARLITYAFPAIGALPVDEITLAMVADVLRPIWMSKIETADKLRNHMENIFDWCAAQGLRSGENPARLRGGLGHVLPKRRSSTHFAALPYSEIGAFMVELRGREAPAARGLELLILTATRTSEVLEAQWSEFDLSAAVWTIPADRTKTEREHRVPLSTRAVDVLTVMHKERTSETWIFPGGKAGKPLSNMAFLLLLERMGRRGSITPHGFRSCFRDWAAETTDYPNEVCEMALAHVIKNAAEAAYRRGDLFEKRRRLMQDWSDYCAIVRE